MRKYIFSLLIFTQTINAQPPRLCGMTKLGNSSGNIFEIRGDGSGFVDLHDFNCLVGGAYPYGNLSQLSGGKLYGTCYERSECFASSGLGEIFSFNISDSSYSTILIFNGFNGSKPVSGMIRANDGKLYGTTSSGGIIDDYGVMYCLNPTNNDYTVLHYFNNIDGESPSGGIMQANNGKLYGVTTFGGIHNRGVIFSFDSINNFNKIYDFDTLTGIEPHGKLVQANNGKLYGLASTGGLNNFGTIFSFDLTDSSYSDLYDFDGINGSQPLTSLILGMDGKLYGTTFQGGFDSTSKGVLFSFDPVSSIYTKLFDFDSLSGHQGYLTDIMQASDGIIYGMTQFYGSNHAGTIFKFNPLTQVFTKLRDFNYFDGASSFSGFIELMPGTGITENYKKIDFTVSSNPFTNELTLHFKNPTTEKFRIKVFDLAGRITLEQNSKNQEGHVSLNLSSIAPGMYFVEVGNHEFNATAKIIKE